MAFLNRSELRSEAGRKEREFHGLTGALPNAMKVNKAREQFRRESLNQENIELYHK